MICERHALADASITELEKLRDDRLPMKWPLPVTGISEKDQSDPDVLK
jgi:hypothetical protein